MQGAIQKKKWTHSTYQLLTKGKKKKTHTGLLALTDVLAQREILRGVWGTLPSLHQIASHIRACMGGSNQATIWRQYHRRAL